MFNYSEAKQFLIQSLTHDAMAHEAGRRQEVGRDFDEFDANLPRDDNPEFDQMFIALNFWDGWIDARNHNWLYYDDIEQSDWPKLARAIIQSIANNREIDEPLVLKHFNLQKAQPFRERVKSLLNGFRGK